MGEQSSAVFASTLRAWRRSGAHVTRGRPPRLHAERHQLAWHGLRHGWPQPQAATPPVCGVGGKITEGQVEVKGREGRSSFLRGDKALRARAVPQPNGHRTSRVKLLTGVWEPSRKRSCPAVVAFRGRARAPRSPAAPHASTASVLTAREAPAAGVVACAVPAAAAAAVSASAPAVTAAAAAAGGTG
eukprot:365696-Chlamydomonas_euryale.AAC.3